MLWAFNPAGGLRYHLRALISQRKRWAPFRESVGRWLAEWNAPRETLIIFGASGGYCLTSAFLEGFARVIAVDPDPLAKLAFKRRHRRLRKLEWVSRDLFADATLGELSRFLGAHSQAAVLFSNFVGQLGFVHEETAAAFRDGRLLMVLGDRPWASFHDRLSGDIGPPDSVFPFHSPRRLEDGAIVELLSAPGRQGELMDHECGGIFPAELPHSYFGWNLRPGSWHLIEAVRSPQ